MIHSKDLERQLLAGLIQWPSAYSKISALINENDFYTGNDSYVHQTIFKFIKRFEDSGDGQALDEVILIERIKAANISFPDNIEIGDYIKSLSLKKVAENSIESIAKELKGWSVRREIYNTCGSIRADMKQDSARTLPDIIKDADKIYNEKLSFYSHDNLYPENIYDDMEDFIEDLADNPRGAGMLIPHMPYLNSMYGSLFRPGNISVVCARTGVGKTTFCLDIVTQVSAEHDHAPILHFDNGEMSKLELQMRMCAAVSGVPLSLIEDGLWRETGYVDPSTGIEYTAEQTAAKVYKAFKKMKDRKFHYFNVGGMSVDQMLQIARRFYYRNVGRGNPMILSFDYIKTTNEPVGSNKSSWDLIGDMIDKFKQFIQREICFNNKPMISMITSVQSNRMGIVGNRGPDGIVEDDSIIAGSDKINSFCSHLFILRPRLHQELQVEPDSYRRATHRLKCVKYRHLGPDRKRAQEPVLVPALNDDGEAVGTNRSEDNALLLRIDNFRVEEVGDLRDMAAQMRTGGIAPDIDGEDDEFIP